MENVERIKSGVKGLDELIAGGFPKDSTILVTGTTGTGKTTLCLNFLVNGALKYKEPGVYVSLEEEPERVLSNIKSSFSWPIDELIKKNMIKIVKAEIYDFDKLKILIEDEVDALKAKRLVIDPTTIISLYFEKPLEIRRSIFDLDRAVKKLGCTTLMTSEVSEGTAGISAFGVEEFVTDGIIILFYYTGKEFAKASRAISIRKMRATKHDTGIHPIEITRDGIVVYPSEKVKGV